MSLFFRFETAVIPPRIALDDASMKPVETTSSFFKRLFEFPKRHGVVNSTATGLIHTDPVQFDHSDVFSTSSPRAKPQMLSRASTWGTSGSHVQDARYNSTSNVEAPRIPNNAKQSRTRSFFAAMNPRRLLTRKDSKKSRRNVPLEIGAPYNFQHLFHTSKDNFTPPTIDEVCGAEGEKLIKDFDELAECVASNHSIMPQESQDIGSFPDSPHSPGSPLFPGPPRFHIPVKDGLAETPRRHTSTHGLSASPPTRKPVPHL